MKDSLKLNKVKNIVLVLFPVVLLYCSVEILLNLVKETVKSSGILWITILLLTIIYLIFQLVIRNLGFERKFLLALGFYSLALNISIYFIDISGSDIVNPIYNSMLLFLGEYNVLSSKDNSSLVLLFHNIGRFSAFAAFYGSILVFFLRKQFLLLIIWLTHKDIVIISDKPQGHIMDLAYGFTNQKRNVVVGFIDNDDEEEFQYDGDIPIIYINTDNKAEMGRALMQCNVMNVKKIFLLCDSTEDNVKIAKFLYDEYILQGKKNVNKIKKKLNERWKKFGDMRKGDNDSKVQSSSSKDNSQGNSDSEASKSDKAKIIYKYKADSLFGKYFNDVCEAISPSKRDDEYILADDREVRYYFREQLAAMGFNLDFQNKALKKIEDEKKDSNEKDCDEKKKNYVKCFIQFKEDEERYFYSYDEAFLNTEDCFDTHFINPYDISVRQMLLESQLNKDGKSLNTIVESGINICVSGNGKLLNRTILELTKNRIYSTKKLKLYYVSDCEDELVNKKIDELNEKLQMVSIIKVDYSNLDDLFGEKKIHQYFISAKYEPEIRAIIQKVYQSGVGEKVLEYFILTEGSDTEFGILENYLKSLLSQEILELSSHTINQYKSLKKGIVIRDRDSSYSYTEVENNEMKESFLIEDKTRIYLGRISDLLMSYEDFYSQYGPKSKVLRDKYLESLKSTSLSKDFSKLPEIFKDSDILSVINIENTAQMLVTLYKEKFFAKDKIEYRDLINLILDLSVTEQLRWYNERVLQGFVYSEKANKFTNMKDNLKPYSQLSIDHKKEHHNYNLISVDQNVLKILGKDGEIKSQDRENKGIKKINYTMSLKLEDDN